MIDSSIDDTPSSPTPDRAPSSESGLPALRRLWQRHQRFATGLFLSLLFFSLYYHNLRGLSGLIYWFNNRVFYSDTRDTYYHMKRISLEGDMRKHPLFSVTVHPMVSGVKRVLDTSNREAARLVLAFLAALNLVLFFLLLENALRDPLTAFLSTLLYGVLFSNLFFFGIPETYALTNLGVLLFFLLLWRFSDPWTPRSALAFGFAAGIEALLNPPLGLLLLSVVGLCFRRMPFRKAVLTSAMASALAMIAFLGANLLLFGVEFFEYSSRYTAKWAGIGNFVHPGHWVSVFVSFFLFSILSPLEELERSIQLRDLAGYFRNPVVTIVFVGTLGWIGVAIWRLWRRLDDLLLAALVWLAVAFLFYVYFNPKESFLYSVQILGPLGLILSRGYSEWPWRWKSIPLILLVAGVGWVNLTSFHG